MPNWCANRLYFRGQSDRIDDIRRLLEGQIVPWYRRAQREGIQLFLAGCAGILQPPETVAFSLYPSLTASGSGIMSPEGMAYARWLRMLQDGVMLDMDNSQLLHELWLACGIQERRWQTLTEAQKTVIEALYRQKIHDWGSLLRRKSMAEWWDGLCDGGDEERTEELDMLLILPTRLDVEINGFNGGLLADVPSAYHWYVEHYGVKWPSGQGMDVSGIGHDFIMADFDTPWSPPSEALLAALSLQWQCDIEHWFAEQGCDFCGYARYLHGDVVESRTDALEWSELPDDEPEAFPEVIGPDWLIDNVAHFGG